MTDSSMNSKCRQCGNLCDDLRLFCSDTCRDKYIVGIEKRVTKATEEDPSHTAKLSED